MNSGIFRRRTPRSTSSCILASIKQTGQSREYNGVTGIHIGQLRTELILHVRRMRPRSHDPKDPLSNLREPPTLLDDAASSTRINFTHTTPPTDSRLETNYLARPVRDTRTTTQLVYATQHAHPRAGHSTRDGHSTTLPQLPCRQTYTRTTPRLQHARTHLTHATMSRLSVPTVTS
jgi:hypothetical protein